MITPEIMLIIVLILNVAAVYMLYVHFESQTDNLDRNMHDLINAHNKTIDIWEQKLKDGLQSNAICCRSAIDSGRSLIDKINSRIAILEKNQTGSIKVVKREAPKKINHE